MRCIIPFAASISPITRGRVEHEVVAGTDPGRSDCDEKPECRVLQVFSVLGVGGAEVWLLALLKYFNEHRDHLPVRLHVDICLTGSERGQLEHEAMALGAHLHRVPYSKKALRRFVMGFRRVLRQGKYDVIHDHQDYMAGWHFLAGVGVLPPVRIAHAHNTAANFALFFSNPARRAFLLTGKRLLSRLATHITGTSMQLLREYGFDEPAFSRTNVAPAHCGFDARRFRNRGQVRTTIRQQMNWPENAKVLLFVGRLDSNYNQKNPTFALNVARACIKMDPGVRLLMAGGGDDAKRELEAVIHQWGLRDHIRLLGVRPDVPDLMCAADLLLFPSIGEGLGMVAVEAQAAGIPVLASNRVPQECVVLSNMVRFRSLDDSADEWAAEVLRMLDLPKPDPMACNQAVMKSPFSIENSANHLLSLYCSAGLPGPSLSNLTTSVN
jgi:glycosyltransferase involved in cell wall biosynthesis